VETVRELVLSVRLEMEYAEELCMLARLLLRKILQLLIYRLGSEIFICEYRNGHKADVLTPLGCVQAKKDM
jgi:hypothetical protein